MTTAAPAVAAPKNGSMPHLPLPPPTPPKFVASQLVDIGLVEADPHNPRKDFPKEAMNELISSIMLYGVRSPIEVRSVAGGKYRVVFGERRYRAAKAAGLKQVPAIVRTLTDIEAAEVQLDENLKRAELSPLEVAGGYQRQLELGRTMEQLCERAGKKRTQVYATLQLLQLGPEARKSLGEERISASVAMLVARVPKALQPKALSLVEPGENFPAATYREAERALTATFTVELKRAAFDTKDGKLCPAAGSCVLCPKRSGNAAELFPDIKSPDVCTDKACFDAKTLADARRALEAKGWEMLEPQVPAFELFHNEGRGVLRQESGYVDPGEPCFDDAKSRPYTELLPTEALKRLVRVALDADGKPRQLLQRQGLLREVKKAGLFQERKKPSLPTATREEKAAIADKAKQHAAAVAAPSADDLIDAAVVGKMVAAAEKRGATPWLLRLLIRELFGHGYNMEACARRGWKDPGAGRPSEKELLRTTGPLATSQLVGLLFECVVGPRYMNGDGFDDIAGELGVDVEKVRAEVEAKLNAAAVHGDSVPPEKKPSAKKKPAPKAKLFKGHTAKSVTKKAKKKGKARK